MNKSCGIVVPTLGTRNSLIESLKSIRLSSRAHICLVAPESFEVFDHLFDLLGSTYDSATVDIKEGDIFPDGFLAIFGEFWVVPKFGHIDAFDKTDFFFEELSVLFADHS